MDSAPTCTVDMIGAVGDDMFGRELIAGLASDGVGVSGIQVKQGQKSGVAVIIVEEGSGENRILMSPNANFALGTEDVAGLLPEPPEPALLVLQLEIRLETVLGILERARGRGGDVEVLLNPAPARKLPVEAYGAVDHLVVNETEAGIITDTTAGEQDWALWGEHVERLVGLGVRHVLVTLGAKGVIYIDSKVRRVLHVLGEKVAVVDSTGAGDTFVGAYAGMLATSGKEHREFAHMVHFVAFANRAAAKTVQREGVQSAIPWRDEVSSENALASTALGISFDEWKQGKDPAVKQ